MQRHLISRNPTAHIAAQCRLIDTTKLAGKTNLSFVLVHEFHFARANIRLGCFDDAITLTVFKKVLNGQHEGTHGQGFQLKYLVDNGDTSSKANINSRPVATEPNLDQPKSFSTVPIAHVPPLLRSRPHPHPAAQTSPNKLATFKHQHHSIAAARQHLSVRVQDRAVGAKHTPRLSPSLAMGKTFANTHELAMDGLVVSHESERNYYAHLRSLVTVTLHCRCNVGVCPRKPKHTLD